MKIALIHSDTGSSWTHEAFDAFATKLRDDFLRAFALLSDALPFDIFLATPTTELSPDTVRFTFGKTEQSVTFSAELPRSATLPSGTIDFKRAIHHITELTRDAELPDECGTVVARNDGPQEGPFWQLQTPEAVALREAVLGL